MDGEILEGTWPISQPSIDTGPLRFVPAAIQALERIGVQVVPVELWVESNLPAGRGFSSSAAFSLGILDAIARISGHVKEASELVELAFEVEHDILGIGCGRLDPAACAAGQPLFLRWSPNEAGSISMHAHRVAPLKPYHFVVGAFERPRDTARILATLNSHHRGPLHDADGDAVREAISEFGSAAEAGAHAMQTGDTAALGDAMNHAQSVYEANLASRFSSTQAPRLVQTCRQLRSQGAIGAKFSGAGGDGSFLALFGSENEARAAAIQMEEHSLQVWYTEVGPT